MNKNEQHIETIIELIDKLDVTDPKIADAIMDQLPDSLIITYFERIIPHARN